MNNPLKGKSLAVQILVLVGILLVAIPITVYASSWIYGNIISHEGAGSFTVTVSVEQTEPIETGDQVLLTGSLTRNGLPVPNADIVLELMVDETGTTTLKYIGTPQTDASGDYSYTWTCDRNDPMYYFRPRYDKDTYTP